LLAAAFVLNAANDRRFFRFSARTGKFLDVLAFISLSAAVVAVAVACGTSLYSTLA